jgi:hypothetical protein
MRWLYAARARLRLLFARRSVESRMDQEFRLHLELETERLVRDERLPPDEARRRARVAFGGIDGHKERCAPAAASPGSAACRSNSSSPPVCSPGTRG